MAQAWTQVTEEDGTVTTYIGGSGSSGSSFTQDITAGLEQGTLTTTEIAEGAGAVSYTIQQPTISKLTSTTPLISGQDLTTQDTTAISRLQPSSLSPMATAYSPTGATISKGSAWFDKRYDPQESMSTWERTKYNLGKYTTKSFWGGIARTTFGISQTDNTAIPRPDKALGQLFEPIARTVSTKKERDIVSIPEVYQGTNINYNPITQKWEAPKTETIGDKQIRNLIRAGAYGKTSYQISEEIGAKVTTQLKPKYETKVSTLQAKYQGKIDTGGISVEQAQAKIAKDIEELNKQYSTEASKLYITKLGGSGAYRARQQYSRDFSRLSEYQLKGSTLASGALIGSSLGSSAFRVGAGTIIAVSGAGQASEGLGGIMSGQFSKENFLKAGIGIGTLALGTYIGTKAIATDVTKLGIEAVSKKPSKWGGERFKFTKDITKDTLYTKKQIEDFSVKGYAEIYTKPTKLSKTGEILGFKSEGYTLSKLKGTDFRSGKDFTVYNVKTLSGEAGKYTTAGKLTGFTGKLTSTPIGETAIYGDISKTTLFTGKLAKPTTIPIGTLGRGAKSEYGDFLFSVGGKGTTPAREVLVKRRGLKLTGEEYISFSDDTYTILKLPKAKPIDTGLSKRGGLSFVDDFGYSIIKDPSKVSSNIVSTKTFLAPAPKTYSSTITQQINKAVTGTPIPPTQSTSLTQQITKQIIGGKYTLPVPQASTTTLVSKQMAGVKLPASTFSYKGLSTTGGKYGLKEFNIVSPVLVEGTKLGFKTKQTKAPAFSMFLGGQTSTALENLYAPPVVIQAQQQQQQQKVGLKAIQLSGLVAPQAITQAFSFAPPTAFKTFIPFAFLPSLNLSGGARGKSVQGGKPKRRYTPSFSAIVFKIKGKRPKGIETGLRLRPIPKGFKWAKKIKGFRLW